MTNRRLGTASLLLLTSLLVFPALSLSAPASSRRTRAVRAYQRAVSLREKVAATPRKDRKTTDYRVLILAFHAVYRLDPSYTKAPVSLEDIAEIYREMGQVFSEERYFTESIKSYQFLMEQYPYYSGSHRAPLNVGDEYIVELHDPEQARKWIQKYLDKYPHSDKAPDARARLEAINHALESVPPLEPASDSETSPGGVPQVTEIRHWVGPHYTRIVIGLDSGQAKFETLRLSNPDRIVLDLLDTHLSPSLAGMKFPVEDGFLRQVRVGQFKPNITRVVLDVEKVKDYFIFPLPNPFRLVVDVHGPPEKTAPKAVVAQAGTAKEEKATAAPSSAPPRASESAAAKPESKAAGSGIKSTDGEPVQTATTGVDMLPAKPAKPTAAGSRTLTRALGLKIGRIVIDPGHGGHDTGTIGPTGLKEKDVVLDVALRLAKLLRDDAGSDVILTRSKDTFIPLEERTAIANEKAADLFVSIHANSSRDRHARGIETYYMNFTSDPHALEVAARENATSQESVHELRDLIKKIALTEKVEESHEFATQVQRAIYARLEKATGKQKDRGVKKAPFVVLIGANMPSILAEISFLSNPSDERLLKHSDYRQKIAEALDRGILHYAQNLGGIKVAQRGGPMGKR